MARHRSMHFPGDIPALLLLAWCLLGCLCTHAQDRTYKQTMVTEVMVPHNAWLVRWRPLTYSLHSGLAKFDLIAGRKLYKSWYLYAWYRSDSAGKRWLGPRTDYTARMLHKKLRVKLEARYLPGLNSRTQNQLYLIKSSSYQFAQGRLGALAFYRNNLPNDHALYLGPTASVAFGPQSGFFITYTSNVLGCDNLLLAFMYFKIKSAAPAKGAAAPSP